MSAVSSSTSSSPILTFNVFNMDSAETETQTVLVKPMEPICTEKYKILKTIEFQDNQITINTPKIPSKIRAVKKLEKCCQNSQTSEINTPKIVSKLRTIKNKKIIKSTSRLDLFYSDLQ